MRVTTGLVLILTALFAGISNGDNTPPPAKARLAVQCSKAFIWAGSIEKSQPIIKKITETYYNSKSNQKAIEDYKKILDKYKNDIGNSGKNMFQCMTDLDIGDRFDVLEFGECRKLFNAQDIPDLLIPIVLKDIKRTNQINNDVKNAIRSKYKCTNPENATKPECQLPEKYETCVKTS
ncbi:uncharacterized protein [Diabrotica undecimpunctata]|uniref:uncharacterized protein n=1 Tax=Diabrotica undecimpunctata TaxID=50387 RepID=UPI003B63CCA8